MCPLLFSFKLKRRRLIKKNQYHNLDQLAGLSLAAVPERVVSQCERRTPRRPDTLPRRRPSCAERPCCRKRHRPWVVIMIFRKLLCLSQLHACMHVCTHMCISICAAMLMIVPGVTFTDFQVRQQLSRDAWHRPWAEILWRARQADI